MLSGRGAETGFITAGKPFEGRPPSGIAELLGMTQKDFSVIYDIDNPESAYSRAIKPADGVLCTDWNHFSAHQQAEIASDAWNAPMSLSSNKIQNESNQNPAGNLASWRKGILPSEPRIPGCH